MWFYTGKVKIFWNTIKTIRIKKISKNFFLTFVKLKYTSHIYWSISKRNAVEISFCQKQIRGQFFFYFRRQSLTTVVFASWLTIHNYQIIIKFQPINQTLIFVQNRPVYPADSNATYCIFKIKAERLIWTLLCRSI